eukprot:gene17196-22716_t
MGFGQSKQVNDENDNTDLDKNHPDNKKLIHEGWTDIKDKKRGCTDILFMLLLILTWIAMTIVGFIACGIIKSTVIPVGNPKRLIYATDYKGAICGVDYSVRNKPKAYYLLNGQVVCIKTCPDTNNIKSYYCKYPYQSAADNSTKTAASYVQDNYCIFKYKTSNVLNRCIPNVAVSYINEVLQNDYNVTTSYTSPSTTSGWFNDFLSDVYKYSEFIVALGQGVLSLSIVSWYFNKNKSSVNNGNVIWAFKTMSFYHLGSFALVADFVLLLGKLFIPGFTVFICYLVMAYSISSNDINGIIAPLVFVADEEMFSPADRFADGSLQSTLQKTAQQAAAIKAIKIHPQAENIVMLDEKGNSII